MEVFLQLIQLFVKRKKGWIFFRNCAMIKGRKEKGEVMEYRIIRSSRRTMALQIEKNGDLVVRAPYCVTDARIASFVSEHTDWVEKQRARIAARTLLPLSLDEIKSLRARAEIELPRRTAYWAERMGVDYTRVTITSAEKRFGSCNSRGGIAYSYRLMQFPEAVIDYVVVHELAHRKEMNHSARFYAVIEQQLPDYKERIKLMKSTPRAM